MKSIKGVIFDIKRYALHDGPGIRTTVFFKGCSLNCWWCHNPEGINPQLKHIQGTAWTYGSLNSQYDTIGRVVTDEDVLEEIKRDWIFYEQSEGGITFSGGEPLMQPEFLSSLLKKCKLNMEVSMTLDTSGYASWETIEMIKEEIDLFLYDIKFIDNNEHMKYTGVSNTQILNNLETLDKQTHNIIIRFPVIPGITDTHSNIDKLSNWLQERSTISEIHLLPYHNIAKAKYHRLGLDYHLEDLETPSVEDMNKIFNKFKDIGFKVKIGG
ncbi:MAG: glycyl-radical enzyme activating protein [Candidatus Hodarchaeales archaeon]|jgi:pyruvate formate lyase activating enzyme